MCCECTGPVTYEYRYDNPCLVLVFVHIYVHMPTVTRTIRRICDINSASHCSFACANLSFSTNVHSHTDLQAYLRH